MPATLLKSTRYAKFVADRDKALERVHQNAQTDISRITYAMLSQIENFASAAAIRASTSYMTHQTSVQFENGVRDIMTHFFPLLVRRIINMRRAVFVITYGGEQEAIGLATQRSHNLGRGAFKKHLSEEINAPTLLGALDKRVWLALMNMRRDVVRAFELAVTQELPPAEIVAKVKDALPKAVMYKKPPLSLVKPREAAAEPKKKKSWIDTSFIDDADWDLAVSAYKDTELPPTRFDNAAEMVGGQMRYKWEVEQEATEDFVRSVRSGQVKAAQDLGVKEFVWIAIIDDKTCEECCLPRNGKTTSEIEQMDDDCDGVVPPAHFNCRCALGPVASVNEVQGPDWASFNEWLEPKAA